MSDEDLVRIVDETIDVAALRRRVEDPRAGAVATFEGVVRDHNRGVAVDRLEYDAYAPMAEKEIAGIVDAARERWQLHRLAVVHRVGRLEVGEVAVAVVVSSSHRATAFDACRYVIDRLKERAPIWKKEFGADGSHWLEGPEDVVTGGGAGGEEGDGGDRGDGGNRGSGGDEAA